MVLFQVISLYTRACPSSFVTEIFQRSSASQMVPKELSDRLTLGRHLKVLRFAIHSFANFLTVAHTFRNSLHIIFRLHPYLGLLRQNLMENWFVSSENNCRFNLHSPSQDILLKAKLYLASLPTCIKEDLPLMSPPLNQPLERVCTLQGQSHLKC